LVDDMSESRGDAPEGKGFRGLVRRGAWSSVRRGMAFWILSVLATCAVWALVGENPIPGRGEPLWTLPLWAKGVLWGVGILFLYGILQGGRLLVVDARALCGMTAQRTSASAGIRWYRYLNPFGPVYNLYRHRYLIWQFMRREIEGRYKGTYLGIVWSMIHPLLMLGIYSFAFSVVLQARWRPDRPEGIGEFAITLFAGLIAFNFFSECANRAPSLIVSAPNYVRKVVFPLEILPVSVLGSALFHGAVSTGVLVLGGFLVLGTVPREILWLPIAALPLIAFSLGLSWFLAAMAVYVRDVGYATNLATQMLFFMTPVFYPLELVPDELRPFLRLNPLAEVVEGFRRVLVWQQPIDWGPWLIVTLASAVLLLLGYGWFMKTKGGFADVL
jgi:lipopolysaccharide transport system permease protein